MIPLKHRACVLGDGKSHLLFHFFSGSRGKKKKASFHHCSTRPRHTGQEGDTDLLPEPTRPPTMGTYLRCVRGQQHSQGHRPFPSVPSG